MIPSWADLLSTVLVAACLGAVAWAVLHIARRPALAHALFLVAMVKLVAPPLLPVAVLPAAKPPTAAASVEQVVLLPLQSLPADLVDLLGSVAAGPAATPSPSVVPGPLAFDWPRGLLLAWACGSLLVAATLWRRARRFARATRTLRPAPAGLQEELRAQLPRFDLARAPELSLVDAEVPPMVYLSRWRYRVLLPARCVAELSPAAVRALLAHELAHVRRRDPWVRVFEAVATVLWWWLPVLWWLRAGLRDAEERSCDAWVAALLPESREDYCRALLRAATGEPELPVPAFASAARRCSNWKKRLEDIMCREIPPQTTVRSRLLTLMLAAAVLPLALTARAQDQADKPADVATMLSQPVQAHFEVTSLDEWSRWLSEQTGVPFTIATSARQADPKRTALCGLTLPAMPASRVLNVIAAITDLRWRANDAEVILEAGPAVVAAQEDPSYDYGSSGRSCYVFGEAKKRGPMPLQAHDTVFDVLSRCGWTDDANLGHLSMIRPDKEQPLVMTIDLGEMIKTGRMASNFLLRRGDILFLPRLQPQPVQAPPRLAVGSRLDFVLYFDVSQPDCGQLGKLAEPQTVARDGTIFVPYVGQMKVVGLRREEVAEQVRTALHPLFAFEVELHARFLDR